METYSRHIFVSLVPLSPPLCASFLFLTSRFWNNFEK